MQTIRRIIYHRRNNIKALKTGPIIGKIEQDNNYEHLIRVYYDDYNISCKSLFNKAESHIKYDVNKKNTYIELNINLPSKYELVSDETYYTIITKNNDVYMVSIDNIGCIRCHLIENNYNNRYIKTSYCILMVYIFLIMSIIIRYRDNKKLGRKSN